MSEEIKPIVYILRGDDQEAIKSHVKSLYSKLGEPDMAEMNTTRLEGKSADLNESHSSDKALDSTHTTMDISYYEVPLHMRT
ncbi:MAG: hypothetical protein SVP52_05370 [Chloroflexota bacterium]|nr:hypothetical protein [Chloroflexota bacterium]